MTSVWLAVAVGAALVSLWAWLRMMRHASNSAGALKRITTFGPAASADAFDAVGMRYRTIGRWARRIMVVSFLAWAYLATSARS